jgi:hypothetical protein
MHPKRAGSITSVGFGEESITGFKALAVLKDARERISLLGHGEDPPRLTPQEIGYLRAGHSLLSVQPLPNGPVRIFMSRVLDIARPTQGILVGEINPTFLWDTGEEGGLPFLTELCVLDQSNNPCSARQVSLPPSMRRWPRNLLPPPWASLSGKMTGRNSWQVTGGSFCGPSLASGNGSWFSTNQRPTCLPPWPISSGPSSSSSSYLCSWSCS